MTDKYRVCTLDLESLPNLGFAWESKTKYPSRQNLIAVEREWSIASFAVKWEGDKGDPSCLALPDFKKTYRNDPFDDSQLLDRMYNILDSADLVVGHNVDNFDVRKINARLWKAGSTPPRQRKTYDTLKEARKHFLLPGYGLGEIAEFLGCPFGGKMEHEGFKLWVKCMNGDLDAWDRMKAYNIQDVKINQWIYHRMRPWSRSHPNITLNGDQSNLCPVCGYKTKPVDWSNLKSYKVERWRCLRKTCGKTSFGKRVKLDIKVLTS
jgi:hypothetical protein